MTSPPTHTHPLENQGYPENIYTVLEQSPLEMGLGPQATSPTLPAGAGGILGVSWATRAWIFPNPSPRGEFLGFSTCFYNQLLLPTPQPRVVLPQDLFQLKRVDWGGVGAPRDWCASRDRPESMAG